jgi:hypothetical protein
MPQERSRRRIEERGDEARSAHPGRDGRFREEEGIFRDRPSLRYGARKQQGPNSPADLTVLNRKACCDGASHSVTRYRYGFGRP